MREARRADTEAIEGFLKARTETTMFLRANLREHGPAGGDGPGATRMWVADAAGEVHGVLGLSNAGVLFVELALDSIRPALVAHLAGRKVRSIVGQADQVAAINAALGLCGAPVRRAEAEPLYALEIDDLVIPPGTTTLRLAARDDIPWLTDWRAAYLGEVLAVPPAEAADQARLQIPAMVEHGTLAVLDAAGVPVAMTAFNAALPEIVQIGNVYTPQALRGRGYARRAVALHLDEARQEAVRRAVLSASGPSASRAYEAIGFRRVGSFMMLMFDGPQEIAGR